MAITIVAKKQSLLLPVLVAGVTFMAVIAGFVMLQHTANQIADKHKKLAQLQFDVTALDAILVDEKAFHAEMLRVQRTIPNGYTEFSQAIGAIEQAAKNSQVTLDLRIDETAKPEPSGIKSVNITMQTSGSFTSTSAFLHAISLLPYHTQVDTMDLGGNAGKVAGTISMRLFIHE